MIAIRLTQSVQQARCAHCNRVIGYRTCAPQQRGKVTHGICLPFCAEARANGWGDDLEKPLLAKRPWLGERKQAA